MFRPEFITFFLLFATLIHLNKGDEFMEEIFIKPLPPSHLYVYFQFITLVDGDSNWYPIVLRTNGAMVSLPTPDFSMPYNVICLACTVVALAFGPLHNICTKELVLKAARSIVPCNECQKVVGEFIKDKEEKIKLDKQNAKLKKLKEFKSKLKNILIDVEKSNEMKKFESTRRTQSETSLRKQDSTFKKQVTNDYEILESYDIANKIHKYLRKQPVRQIETTPLYTSRAESELSIVGPVRRQRDNERQRSIHFKHSQDNVELVSLPGSSDYISLENKYYIQGNKNIPRKTDLYIKRQFSSERDLSSDAPFREKTTEKIPFKQKVEYKRDHHLSYHDIRDSRHEESDILQKQENEFIKEIPKRSLSDTNVRGYMSEESLRSISTATRNVARKDFSYFFIKKTDITKKRQMISLSSSELVKNTQDMYRARAEEAKIKKEQELKQKLEGDEKRRIPMEEKRKWQDEEKIKIDKEIKGEKEIPKSSEESLEVKEALEIQEKEEVKEISIKMEREIVSKEAEHKKREDKEGKNDEEKEVHQRKREEKGKEKSLKEEQMRLTKEEKLKLKEEKEREKELKKDQLRLAHEEKQRLKEEKEREKAEKKEQMRLANEEKKRLKEEKEKEKALKKDQSHLANEEKKRLKEEKEKEKPLKKEQFHLANEEKKRLKEKKEKEKALKKDQAHLANEEKQKLKEEKEKEKALTKDLLRLANEEKKLFKEGKEKTKSPKKDQTPLDNQEKQKFKEEKEKEKALKKDEMRLASEEKKRLKEEKEKERAIKKDQMLLENEEKQRLKEEKEKELALKKDLIRLANEEKQKAKESDKLKNRENEEKSSKKDQAMAELMLKIDKESKLRKTQEDEIKKKEAELKFKSLKETKEEEKIQKPAIKKVVEKPQTKELNIDQIKIRRPSPDDLILKLVKLKQSQDSKPKERPTRMSQINLPEKIILSHNKTHKIIKNDNCVICLDSDLDLDIENIMLNEGKSDKSNEIIIGPKIFRYKSPLVLKTEDVANRPLFFTSKPTEDDAALNTNVIGNKIDEEKGRNIPPILAGKYVSIKFSKNMINLKCNTFLIYLSLQYK
ncbi:unnamed protein product [Danaus chrysippus]|uniref:(African queen) hypothetical protein n=1 Tax=Danaus chrysippus TaxID=151541 RepID=A0A8J2RGF0_9NEOP|nr:unnamed protein product [Danaus chrysippus]